MKQHKNYLIPLFLSLMNLTTTLSAQLLQPKIVDSTKGQGERPFVIHESPPEFEGGLKAMFSFLSKNMQYPALSRKYGAEGTAYIGFIVKSDGSLQDIREIKFIKAPSANQKKSDKIPEEAYQDLVKEAIRVVKLMPNWKAAQLGERTKSTAFTLPINFKL
jgi:periplasmic protein TonB